MERQDLMREEAREKLRQAACASDRETKLQLAEAAFQLAQEAEALERDVQDRAAAKFGRTR